MAELWDGRNRDFSLSGVTLARGEPIPQGQYHMVCEAIIRHVDGDILLMRRDPRKPVFPDFWETGASGSALRGEDEITCVRREVSEETGISRGEFTEIARTVSEETRTHYITHVCITDWEKTAIRLQEGETVDFRWVNREQFAQLCKTGKMIEIQLRRYAPYLRQIGWME